MSLTRRTFIGRTMALGAGLALAEMALPLLQGRALAAPLEAEVGADQHPAILYDLTQCLGCHSCEVACQVNKGLPPGTSLISLKPRAHRLAPRPPGCCGATSACTACALPAPPSARWGPCARPPRVP